MIGNKMEGAHIIEVNDLVISMASTLNCGCLGVIKDGNTEFPLLHKIRRTPFDADTDVYKPSVVSIGPYHHKSRATLGMEQTKWESLYYILGLNPERKMRDYLEAMAELEQQIRSCYASTVIIDTDDLLKMMLLDACFMLCILYGTEEGSPQQNRIYHMMNMDDAKLGLEQQNHTTATSSNVDGNQQISSNIKDRDDTTDNTYSSSDWYASYFAHDLLLLENQIPFLVVVKIYELVTNGNSPITILLENVARFVEDLLRSYPKAILNFDHPKEVHHLHYLCHQYFKPKKIEVKIKFNPVTSTSASYDYEAQSRSTGQQLLGWHQSSEHYKAGVELNKREFCIENLHSLLDIQFCEGVMQMPCLTIDTNTHCLFRNLVAFEETCPQFGNYITTYVAFLSQFISMPEDVSLLTKRGIIVHQLDSDAEVSELFKMLVKAVTFDISSDHYLSIFTTKWKRITKLRDQNGENGLGSVSSKLPGWSHEL